ncbi:carboxylating nicotinate-nucleotide diphosphorylase [Halomicronema sp. CCY15110]|uniref:carboxylating nicotinate-nucleotide diphosphorylase n=1 Tax=Halomicronema sp. CCY15110 TaxID=2767773 RepID=UPI001EF35DFE|nr:carboxylating nicotinate-nucleotide diphosphorylase [Halomicronema sp. CCY15110]
MLQGWLQEDIGRGDRTTAGLGTIADQPHGAVWIAKAPGVVAGLPIAQRVFALLDATTELTPLVAEGSHCEPGTAIAEITGTLGALLTGERVALNLAMRLSGIATLTRQYVDKIADIPAQLVDTRKTTPGLRLLEKYATRVGGARNHRLGLDDGVMIKDNHIAAAGSIAAAVAQIRQQIPYPLTIEVETETLAMVEAALAAQVDIIMLDNMLPSEMAQAVTLIRQTQPHIKIEASGNVTLQTLRTVAATGVDYISTSAPITRSPWLDLSMRIRQS